MSINQEPDGSGDFHALVGRALVDQKFRDGLRDPATRAQTLTGAGFNLTPEQLEQLDTAVQEVEHLAKMFPPVTQAAT